ncbi:MAG TPA: hypothetical protein VF660_04215 [Actinomycetota bacterium]
MGVGDTPESHGSAFRGAPTPAILPALRLRADLSEAPARWRLLAKIPFGRSNNELGFYFDRRHGSLPLIPRSFAVAPDGSFWILDDVKGRLAHYSRRGVFVEAVPGLKLDRTSPRPKDLVISDGRLSVLQERKARATLTTVNDDGSLSSQPLTDAGRQLAVSKLFSAPGGLVGLVAGHADPLGTGPSGFAYLPVHGRLRILRGLPVTEGVAVDLNAVADQDLELTMSSSNAMATQPIHVDVVPDAKGRRIKGLVGPGIEARSAHGVGLYVRVTPAEPDEAHRLGDGAWYLRFATDHSPLLWERLPEASVSDEEQVRHLASDDRGRVYLMVPDEEGERIYVR